MTVPPVTVVVADPARLHRELYAGVLSSVEGMLVKSIEDDCDGLVAASRCHRPQVVLSAPTLRTGKLLDVLPAILTGGSRVLVVSSSASDDISDLLLAGASGGVSIQETAPIELVAAVRDVAAGRAALHPAAAAAVLRQWRASRGEPATRAPQGIRLSARESEVLMCLNQGMTTKEIGRRLTISPKTAEAHIARLLSKLGARNRAHAVAVAVAEGLVTAVEETECG